jgi:hypothetical protein
MKAKLYLTGHLPNSIDRAIIASNSLLTEKLEPDSWNSATNKQSIRLANSTLLNSHKHDNKSTFHEKFL